MRDRLKELVKKSLIKHIDKTCMLAENITDDLLANGVIVPPVSVGQTVYRKYWNGGFVKCTVSMITQKADKSFKIRLSYNGSVGDYTEDDFGKTVFLTKEEAEKALAERSGE